MNFKTQQQKCGKNIKLGDSFLLKDLDRKATQFEATIIVHAKVYSMYLFGTNHGDTHFWTAAKFPSSIDQYKDKAERIHNLDCYRFAWWYHIDELKAIIVKRIK